MVKKRKASNDLGVPEGAQMRAAQLRAHVEALARQSDDLRDPFDSSLPEMQPAVHETHAPQIPMLIRTTDTGMYLKWAIMLQDQLARMKAAHDTLKEENARLRYQLGGSAVEVPSMTLAGVAPGSLDVRGSPLTRSASESNTSTKLAELHAASETVHPTPRQAEAMDKNKADASGAAALIALASPKPSPRDSVHSNSPSSFTLGSSAMASSLMSARGTSMPPPKPSCPSAPGCGTTPFSPDLGGGKGSSQSGFGMTEQDELLAELLCSPSLLTASPRLSQSLTA